MGALAERVTRAVFVASGAGLILAGLLAAAGMHVPPWVVSCVLVVLGGDLAAFGLGIYRWWWRGRVLDPGQVPGPWIGR